MRSNFRVRLFLTAFGGAVLTVMFVTLTMAEPLGNDMRQRLFTVALLAIGGALVGALLVSSLLAAPLEQRVDGILSVAQRYLVGDLQRPAPHYGDDEIGEVARAMDVAARALGRRIDELARDRTRMVAILSSMIEGVLVVDENGRLQHLNDAARRMLKLDHDAINRHYVEAIRHPGIVEQIKRVLAGQQAEGLELSLTRGENLMLVAQVAPVIAAGRGAVLVLHDVTDLKRADQIRRDFVANVSHELRTPLTAIKGYIEALMDDPADANSRRQFLEIIQRHSIRMERLVSDLLRLARLDAGQEAPELVDCEVDALITSLITDFENDVAAKNQTVRTNIAPEACTLVTDTAKLHDVLRNLLENAVVYTPNGGTIEISANVSGGRYELAVADNGPGIPPTDLTRVFERFYRVDRSRARPGGTGLGLSIVKNLVGVLGGEVVATNRPNGGAVFTVRLPMREA